MKQVKCPSNRNEKLRQFSNRNEIEPNRDPTTEPNSSCWEVAIQSQTITPYSETRANPFTNQGISQHDYTTGKAECKPGFDEVYVWLCSRWLPWILCVDAGAQTPRRYAMKSFIFIYSFTPCLLIHLEKRLLVISMLLKVSRFHL